MNTTAEPPVEMTFEIVPADAQLPAEQKHTLEVSFGDFFKKAAELRTQAETITSPKLARVARLEIRKLRTDADKKRKALKEDSMRYGKAIDGANNILLEILVPIERRMDEIEKAEERRIEAENTARGTARFERLAAVGMTVYLVSQLGTMAESDYAPILKDATNLHEARLKREQEEADAKLQKEVEEAKERQRVREDNERLLKEAEEKEAAAKLEREKAEKEKKALEDKLAAERSEHQRKVAYEREVAEQQRAAAEAKAKEERDALEAKRRAEQAAAKKKADDLEEAARVEREAREKERKAVEAADLARKEDEARKQREAEAAAEAALLAPDKDKLKAVALAVRGILLPKVKSKKAVTALAQFQTKITNLADWIEEKAEEL